MKYFFEAVLFAVFVAALANSSVKPAKVNSDRQKSQCNVNNYFYAGPNIKKIEQQLAEIKEAIMALQRNQTDGSTGKGFLHSVCSWKIWLLTWGEENFLICCIRVVICVLTVSQSSIMIFKWHFFLSEMIILSKSSSA